MKLLENETELIFPQKSQNCFKVWDFQQIFILPKKINEEITLMSEF